MKTMRRPHLPTRHRIWTVAAFCLAALSPNLQAQDKPPLKIVVGFPPGGSADVLARIVADALRDDFGTLVVENKAGGGGIVGATETARAAPDGYSLGMATVSTVASANNSAPKSAASHPASVSAAAAFARSAS